MVAATAYNIPPPPPPAHTPPNSQRGKLPPPLSDEVEWKSSTSPSPAAPFADQALQNRHLKSYIALLESRLLELHPDHPLPITAAHLGQPLPSCPPTSTHPLTSSHIPAFITSSNAVHAKTEKSDRLMIAQLQRQQQHVDNKSLEVTKQNNNLRKIAEQKTKELTLKDRQLVLLKQQNADLLAELNASGKAAPIAASKPAKKPSVSSSHSNPTSHNRIKELLSTVNGLKAELKMTVRELSNSELQVKILDDALQIRSDELNTSSSTLTTISELKGHILSERTSLAHANARIATLEESLTSSAADIASLTATVDSLTSTSSTMKSQFTLLGGDTLTELTAEKNALLDYVTESLDNVAALEEKVAALTDTQTNYAALRSTHAALETSHAALETSHAALETSLNSQTDLSSALQATINDQKTELDEMASMQLELLNQIQAADSTSSTHLHSLQATKRDLEQTAHDCSTAQQHLAHTNAALGNSSHEIQVLKTKLAQIVPKMDSADAELRILRCRLQELEKTESSNLSLVGQLAALQPLKTSLDQVAVDLRGPAHSYASASAAHSLHPSSPTRTALSISSHLPQDTSTAAPTLSKSQWHASWVNTGSLSSLLPSLGDRVHTLFTDFTLLESQLNDTTAILSSERKERDLERRVLSDTCVATQQECKGLTAQVSSSSSELTELRITASHARDAQSAMSQLRTLYLSHCQEEGDNGRPTLSETSDVEIVHSVARALYAGRQASARATQTLQKLVESEAMVKLRSDEVSRLHIETEALSKSLSIEKCSSTSTIALLSTESTAIAAELESAAELAEKQGALALTLEGRLEALMAERAMLSAQFHGCQKELDDVGVDLREALYRCNERGRGVVSENDGIVVNNNTLTSTVVRNAIIALDVMSGRVASTQHDLVAAQARAEMREVGLLARSNARPNCTPRAELRLGTPAREENDDDTGDLLNRQKAQVAEMGSKWGITSTPLNSNSGIIGNTNSAMFNRQREQQQRIASITKSAQSVRSIGSSLETPGRDNRGGGGLGDMAGSSTRGRAPSPGAQLLQERLRKAQAAFATLSK